MRAAQCSVHRALHLGYIPGDAELHEGLPAKDGIRAAEECRIPAVLTLLDGSVEERRLAAQWVANRHIAEQLRSLHEGDPFVVEVAERLVEDPRLRHLIRVEDE